MRNTTRFNLTADDYVEANRLHATRAHGGGWLKLATVMSLIYAALAFLILGKWDWRNAAAAVALGAGMAALVMLIIAAANHVMIPRRSRRIFAQQKALHDEVEAEWDEAALGLATPTARSRHGWADFRKWTEGPNVILLYQSDALFNMLPKRAFSAEALVAIRESLGRAHVRQLTGWR